MAGEKEVSRSKTAMRCYLHAMTKVVFARMPKARKGAPATVAEKRVRTQEGQLRTVRTVDADSPSFGDDVTYVFTRNVAKARRDNKRVIGANDVVVPKR